MIAPPGFLATPVGEHLSDLVREAFEQAGPGESDSPAAERFGPYRVTGEIGRGGMGMVYEAERADRTYDRRVAIKTVRFARAGGRLANEFEAERRILAGLEHENISRLYDAGTTPDDIPYFVMELVEGRRIDVYCDEENLSVDERLALFERVCEAVEYAHGKLIVHGDIKPGNILVTDDGVPKLLDFGVARLLESAEPDRGPVGADRPAPAPAMTPEYASPEQLRGEPVTTASDVYALVGLGQLLVEQARSDECETPLREALALRETALDPEHPSVMSTRGWLGLCLVESGDRTSSDPARRNEGLSLLEGFPPWRRAGGRRTNSRRGFGERWIESPDPARQSPPSVVEYCSDRK